MLEIQNQPQIQATSAVNFKGGRDYERYSFDDEIPDSFDKAGIVAERDEKLDKINESKSQFDSLADELENSDNKLVQKSGKLVRFGATALGIIGTFVVAKYSSKMAIETLKSVAKHPAIKTTLNTLKEAKKPAGDAAKAIKDLAGKALENPKVKEGVEKFANSKVVTAAKEILKNEKVAKVLDPLKTTIDSIKGIKINGKSIQSTVENIMAGATTGSVIVDDLTGRNNDKSVVDLATGV